MGSQSQKHTNKHTGSAALVATSTAGESAKVVFDFDFIGFKLGLDHVMLNVAMVTNTKKRLLVGD